MSHAEDRGIVDLWALRLREATIAAGVWLTYVLCTAGELYVAGDCRHRAIGKMLMQAVFDVASKHGCSRVEWTTDRDNSGAQAFYATLGLPAQPSKVFYRVEETGTGFQLPKNG